MSDSMSPEQRHFCMSQIHSASTKPELRLRNALWHRGFRYLVNDKRLPGKPDIVFPKYRTVIFVHGCFWHGHSGCIKYRIPKTNSDFWISKITRNQQRDQEVWRQLEAKGWAVIIVWECELKKEHLSETVDSVVARIYHNGEVYRSFKEERKKSRETYRLEQREAKEKTSALKAELNALFK